MHYLAVCPQVASSEFRNDDDDGDDNDDDDDDDDDELIRFTKYYYCD
jgi:hypothetical protein